MRDQACEPCARRKVRCDREEPCSNCKRRKHDRCTYPEPSPFDRIRRLEALVQSLGGDPENDTQHHAGSKRTRTGRSPAQSGTILQSNDEKTASVEKGGRSKDPVIAEENGQQFYLESRAWQDWLGHGEDDQANTDTAAKNPFLTRNHPNAFQAMFSSRDPIDLASRCPSPQDATTLWNVFNQRVNPVVRISFSWALKPLHSISMHPEHQKQLTDAEHAFIFSMYLSSAVSLSDEECQRELHQPRSYIISELQILCEEALSRTNLFCMTDITVLKALTIYMAAGIDRLSTQSLWSLMGLVIRNAEKLGIHRDGTLLGLSPAETEERRRLWWQLQHMDLALAIWSGLTPLTLMADWDAKLPLNIEDDDITPSMKDLPKERKGLTSMSYCLYTYWVLDYQRRFFSKTNGRFELSWQTNKSLPYQMKGDFVSQLEDGLNKNFIQFCDPIKPLDTIISISARALICGFRQRILHPIVYDSNDDSASEEHRDTLLSSCLQSLEYNIAFLSSPLIKHFHWLTSRFFTWYAFMGVLVEASRQHETAKTNRIWGLLSDLYSTNSTLWELSEDRRKAQAAELVITAWKARQNKLDHQLQKPDFVANLETRLAEHRLLLQGGAVKQETNESVATSHSVLLGEEMDALFNIDFQDIDWSFWSGID
ncbi:MAG: hypothetical protein Q9227_005420 [Pyrenula ochraceoflavens]